MKTIEQIKADILATNPSHIYEINGEQFEQTDAEFNDAVDKRAEMEYEQLLTIAQIQAAKEIEEAEAQGLIAQTELKNYIDAKATAQAKLEALGLTVDDLKALGL